MSTNSAGTDNLFHPFERRGFLLTAIQWLLWLLSWANLYFVLIRISKRAAESRPFLEIYLLLWALIATAILLLMHFQLAAGLHFILVWVVAYRLIAILHSRMYYFAAGSVEVAHGRDSLIAAMINVIEVIQGFAILFLWNDGSWNKPVTSGITAVYLSTMTFTTLGYGDITPTNEATQLLVTAELFYFLFILAMTVPILLSLGDSDYASTQADPNQ